MSEPRPFDKQVEDTVRTLGVKSTLGLCAAIEQLSAWIAAVECETLASARRPELRKQLEAFADSLRRLTPILFRIAEAIKQGTYRARNHGG